MCGVLCYATEPTAREQSSNLRSSRLGYILTDFHWERDGLLDLKFIQLHQSYFPPFTICSSVPLCSYTVSFPVSAMLCVSSPCSFLPGHVLSSNSPDLPSSRPRTFHLYTPIPTSHQCCSFLAYSTHSSSATHPTHQTISFVLCQIFKLPCALCLGPWPLYVCLFHLLHLRPFTFLFIGL